MKYVTVSNRPNKIATVHLATCADLGTDPLLKSASAERRGFDDGLEALTFARDERPNNYGFCNHCLSRMRWLK
ncbi:MAG: hypothetical protein HY852_13705 [Bradyrhizobium sp.]|uniref:hypothetical protein n=1 Tax=Bradyrhizobium sp. TaxID=376 RepID=UPI0025BDBD78|nr:hypothetical protein [Bradyrhizobium sp.]MBI5262863.1 hypothetical protein [Bradyrhizobium sp.]